VAVGGERGVFCCASVVGCGLVSGVMAGGWVMAVGIIRLLRSLGMFTWEAVHNEAAKGAPVGHNTSSFSGGKREVREGKLTYLAGLLHHGPPLVLSCITPQL